MNRPRLAARGILAIAGCELAVLLAGAGGDGYHRDELYFIEAGKHPALGYDDQPPLTPLLGRASAALFGETPTGLRVFSALAIAVCVALTGWPPANSAAVLALRRWRPPRSPPARSCSSATWSPRAPSTSSHGR